MKRREGGGYEKEGGVPVQRGQRGQRGQRRAKEVGLLRELAKFSVPLVVAVMEQLLKSFPLNGITPIFTSPYGFFFFLFFLLSLVLKRTSRQFLALLGAETFMVVSAVDVFVVTVNKYCLEALKAGSLFRFPTFNSFPLYRLLLFPLLFPLLPDFLLLLL